MIIILRIESPQEDTCEFSYQYEFQKYEGNFVSYILVSFFFYLSSIPSMLIFTSSSLCSNAIICVEMSLY